MTGRVFGFLLVLLAVDRNHTYKPNYDPYKFYSHNNYSYSYSYDYAIPNQQGPYGPPLQPYQGPANLNLQYFPSYRQGKLDQAFVNSEQNSPDYADDPSTSGQVGDHENRDVQSDSVPAGSHFQQTRDVTATGTPDARSVNHAIVYPQNHHIHSRDDSISLRGSNCNHGICEDADDYPADEFRQILTKTRAFDAFFNATYPDLQSKNFGTENVCGSIVNTTFPRLAVNTEQKKRYIANLEQFKQGIKIETCIGGTESKCKFSEYWPLDYQSACEQRYVVVPLLALDDDKNPVVETFQTPSNCVCTYKIA